MYGTSEHPPPNLKPSSRVEQNSNFKSEYECCLSDLHTTYMQLRSSLLHPATRHHYTHQRTPLRLQNSSSHLIHVCEDEYAPYHQFFALPSDALKTLFEMMCGQLYDTFRPHIIHMITLKRWRRSAAQDHTGHQSSHKECFNASEPPAHSSYKTFRSALSLLRTCLLRAM